jgi:hypothetical protein
MCLYVYIHREVSIFSLARSLARRTLGLRNAVSAEFERFHIRCFYAARAIACFLLLLFHVLALGGGREPPLASRASIPYFFFYRFNLADS